jgi:sec-independent protein translocase protein TatB
MFDVSSSEFLLVMVIALVVIGPKDLPKVLRFVGKWVGKARAITAHFRSGFDDMIRQSELEELEQKWKAENERIMSEHPELPASQQQALVHPDAKPDDGYNGDTAQKPLPLPEPKPETGKMV